MVFHNISFNIGNRVFLFALFATINGNVGIRSNDSSIRSHFFFVFCVFFRTPIAFILFVFLNRFSFFIVLIFRLFIGIIIVFLGTIFATLGRLDLLFAIVFRDFFVFVKFTFSFSRFVFAFAATICIIRLTLFVFFGALFFILSGLFLFIFTGFSLLIISGALFLVLLNRLGFLVIFSLGIISVFFRKLLPRTNNFYSLVHVNISVYMTFSIFNKRIRNLVSNLFLLIKAINMSFIQIRSPCIFAKSTVKKSHFFLVSHFLRLLLSMFHCNFIYFFIVDNFTRIIISERVFIIFNIVFI